MATSHDNIYQDSDRDETRFVFDAAVADVFADMINRSVPGYATILGMLGVIAEKYVQPESNIYDLGCSQGGSTVAVGRHIHQRDCHLIAVDNAAAMIEKCRENTTQASIRPTVELICDDICNIRVENASLVILNLTLQFIKKSERDDLIKNIRQGMLEGAALVLTEKTIADDSQEQAFLTELHLDFKRANGYSDLEISRKRTALETVLIPETDAEHFQRLSNAGFSATYRWFSCVGFNAYIAIA
ncbi:MAG TPA: carboxy-S-adenosyl-L-methionine synthase CmoA [Gammaproteobacteria bacterium]|jgi:tRNA (cmo5U34)-methyltransferase|nr:carboxy-S-adenosyl-L-methionine synthase CmoA [Gammaproteobacteria bacterium]